LCRSWPILRQPTTAGLIASARTTRFNDDGEPAGTAGRPILQAIEGQGMDRVVVVVKRWYGGIKLGAGGLMRAYGGTAAECLRRA
jgi:putative IMPACT (imprinted ancient) family translation regulator